MRRAAIATALVLALALPAAAEAKVHARVTECEPGSAAFTARMDARDDAVTMQMRFKLQSRTEDDWDKVPAGWGEWIDSTAQRLVWTKHVEGLLGPAEYRVVVRFRWLDAAGEVVEAKRRASQPCAQPASQPETASQ